MSLIIHAPNVHQGGGKALLLPLLEAAGKQPSNTALIDERLIVPEEAPQAITVIRITPSILGRLAGEWTLRDLARNTDAVLCFGNLPPLFKLRGRVTVFLQNRYLVDGRNLDGFPFRVKLRLMVERLWLRRRIAHVDTIIVQTRSMQQLAQQALQRTVDVMALSSDSSGYHRQGAGRERGRTATYDFLYVATGEPHKNHWTLLEAWRLLAVDGLRPSLCLTIPEDRFPELVTAIRRVSVEHRLRIENRAFQIQDLPTLYMQAGALIYPSLTESLGLPLIEARAAGLPIIAGELDYVRDVVDPEETFDPQSPVSLARAVKRFLGQAEPALPILRPEEFLQCIVGDH